MERWLLAFLWIDVGVSRLVGGEREGGGCSRCIIIIVLATSRSEEEVNT